MVHQVAWKKKPPSVSWCLWNVSTSHFDHTVGQSSRAVINKINVSVWCQQRSPPKECYWCCTLQLNRHLWTWRVITAAYKRMGFHCGISRCHSALLQDVNSIFYFISVWINPVANWCFSIATAGPKSLCVHSEWKHQIVASLNLPTLAS